MRRGQEHAQRGRAISWRDTQRSKKVPQLYSDYRAMLAQKDLDVVLIGVPDHWHALMMIEAAKSGADVYCQKPISVDVEEGRAMLAAARKYKRVVQVGMQRRSTPHLAEAREEIVKAGKLGKIGLVEVYCYYHMGGYRQSARRDSPATFDYETWTGPAPMRPYSSGSFIRANGARSWSTAMGSSATCACISSICRAGCWIWDGQRVSRRQAESG